MFSNCDTFCFLLFQILSLLFFHLTVAVAVTSVSVFFTVSLDMHSKNQVTAVKEGSDFSDMVNEITKMTD